MRIALIGLGAIGSLYGSKLLNNPAVSLTVLVDQARHARYLQEPLVINEKKLSFHYALPEEVLEPAELVLITTKARQLPAAIEMAKKVSNSQTLFLSLLNGITSEADLLQHFSAEQVLYGMCNGLDAVRAGRNVSYQNAGTISFGKLKNQPVADRVAEVAEIFRQSGIQTEVPIDMQQKIWYKFMVNVGINQISAVTGSPYGIFQKNQEAVAAVKAAMQEVIWLAEAEGIQLTTEHMNDWFLHTLAGLDPAGKTSMLQDIEQKRPTEVELFAGTVKKLAAKHQINVPVNELLYQLITVMEQEN